MSTLLLDSDSFAACFIYSRTTHRPVDTSSLEHLCALLTQFSVSKSRAQVTTHTPLMKAALKWYLKTTIRQPTPLGRIRELQFDQITWDHNLVALLSHGLAFTGTIQKFKIYRGGFDTTTLKGLLCHRILFWKSPLPSFLVLRNCGLGPKEAFCLRKSFQSRVYDSRAYLLVDGNCLCTTSTKVLLDVQARTGLKVIGCTGEVVVEFWKLWRHISSTQHE